MPLLLIAWLSILMLSLAAIAVSTVSFISTSSLKPGEDGKTGVAGPSDVDTSGFSGAKGVDYYVNEDPFGAMVVTGGGTIPALIDVAFDGTTYVFVGGPSRTLARTTDPTDTLKWSVIPLDTNSLTSDFRRIAFGSTYGYLMFCEPMSSSIRASLRSKDGLQWQSLPWTRQASRVQVACDGLSLYVLSLDTNVYTSSDGGDTWIFRTSFSGDVWKMRYLQGQFVAVGSFGLRAYSTDGITWSATTTSGTLSWVEYSSAASLWMVCGTGGIFTSSSLGGTWTLRVALSMTCLVVNGSTSVAFNGTNTVLRSTDGWLNWESVSNTLSTGNLILSAFVINGQYLVSYSGGYSQSSDLSTWRNFVNTQTNPTGSPVSSALWNGILVTADSSFGNVFSTTDGVNWTWYSNTLRTGNGIIGLASLNGVCYAVTGTAIRSSTDLTTWTVVRSSTNVGTPCVASNESTMVVINTSTYERFSGGWTTGRTGATGTSCIIWDSFSGRFLIGASGCLMISSDGLTWTQLQLPSFMLGIQSPRIASDQQGTIRLAGAGISPMIYECKESTLTDWKLISSPRTTSSVFTIQYVKDTWFVLTGSGMHYCSSGTEKWFDRTFSVRGTSRIQHVASINDGFVFPVRQALAAGSSGTPSGYTMYYAKKRI